MIRSLDLLAPLRSSTLFRFECSAPPSKRRRLTTSAGGPPFQVLYFGADQFSCAILNSLSSAPKDLVSEIVVVTPPPSRKDKGMRKVYTPPLHSLAETLSLQAISLPQEGLRNWVPPLVFAKPSPSTILVTASFGHLIPSALLARFHPLHGLNVHPSLLPKYRGAAPIQWAIANGDPDSGVSVQELSRGTFDKGRLLGQAEVRLPEKMGYVTAEAMMAQRGGELLVKVLEDFEASKSKSWLQDSTNATSAPKISKDDARIDWSARSAIELERLQRGLGHQFPLWTQLSPGGVHIQVQLDVASSQQGLDPEILDSLAHSVPGTAVREKASKVLLVRTMGEGLEAVAVVTKVKPAGKHWIVAAEWWNGAPHSDGVLQFSV